jgi:hypothetical protein
VTELIAESESRVRACGVANPRPMAPAPKTLHPDFSLMVSKLVATRGAWKLFGLQG